MAAELLRLVPETAEAVRRNRAFPRRADVRNPAGILGRAAGVLDVSEPVALVLVAIMHFIPDADEPREIGRRYVAALAPGSYPVLSHASMLAVDPDTAEAVRTYAASSAGSFIIRMRDEVAAFFDGLELLEPGLGRGFLEGVGRKR